MLTNRQVENIKRFDELKSNHRNVFRYFLKKKCSRTIEHMIFILSNYEKLNMRPDDIIKVKDLNNLVKLFSRIKERQNYRV